MARVTFDWVSKAAQQRAKNNYNLGAIEMWLANQYEKLKKSSQQSFQHYIKTINATVTGYLEGDTIVVEDLEPGDVTMS